ncbi:unnamed protein product [Sphagnum troendelagicum]
MYAAKLDGEGAAMHDAIIALKDAMVKLEVTIDGGKDSLSMAARARGEILSDKGVLLHIDIGKNKWQLGGSCLAQVYDQGLIDQKVVTFGHDIDDGGIIVALLEMAFASNCGIYANLHVLDIRGIVNAKFVALFVKEQEPSW